jgi:hypothetical protein
VFTYDKSIVKETGKYLNGLFFIIISVLSAICFANYI